MRLVIGGSVGGQWECRYSPRDDVLVYSYNPFGDQWHVYLNITMEVTSRYNYHQHLASDILHAQREMSFYKIERIPLENINKTAEIGQGHS